MTKTLILASQSPRRQELLKQIGLSFIVRTANIDEKQVTARDPETKVKQLAQLKNWAIPLQAEDEVILAADTIVALDGEIFEKPVNKDEARRMMKLFSGNIHSVFTGVAIRSVQKELVFAVETKVEFWPLSDAEIAWYINTDEPYDKAGGYGIQGLASLFIKQIIGDYYNVVGLPISYVMRKLQNFDITLT